MSHRTSPLLPTYLVHKIHNFSAVWHLPVIGLRLHPAESECLSHQYKEDLCIIGPFSNRSQLLSPLAMSQVLSNCVWQAAVYLTVQIQTVPVFAESFTVVSSAV